MCHGTNRGRKPPLDAKRFEGYFHIASQLGFQSISYDDLADWRDGNATLPNHPIMFDFDHPAASIRHEILPMKSVILKVSSPEAWVTMRRLRAV